MTRELVTNGPKGRVLNGGSANVSHEELAQMLLDTILPAVAKTVEDELAKAGAKSEGDDLAANLAAYELPVGDDDYRPGSNGRKVAGLAGGLAGGDQWAGYSLNDLQDLPD